MSTQIAVSIFDLDLYSIVHQFSKFESTLTSTQMLSSFLKNYKCYSDDTWYKLGSI